MSAFAGSHLTVPKLSKGKKREFSPASSEGSIKGGQEPARKKSEKGPCYQCKDRRCEDECNGPLPCGRCKLDINLITDDCSIDRPMKDDISESSVSYGDVTPEHVSSTAQDPTLIGGLAPGVKGTKGIIPIEGSSQGESPSPTLPPLRCLATEDRSPSPDPIPSSGLEKSNTPEIKPAASENVYIKNERN